MAASLSGWENDIKDWIKKKRPKNTTKAYESGASRWLKFQTRHKLIGVRPTPALIAKFAIELHELENLAHGTISNYVNGLADLYRYDQSFTAHRHKLVEDALNQIKRHSAPVKHHDLVEDEHLKVMFQNTDFSDPQQARDHAMRCIALKGALRGSEASSLRRLRVKARNGTRYLECGFRNNQNESTKNQADKDPLIAEESDSDNAYKCAVRAFIWYITCLLNNDINPTNSDYVFFNLSAKDLGKKLSDRHLYWVIKNSKEKAGITANFSAHSLRKFAATMAARNGVAIRLIKEHGGWKSNAIFDYIESSLDERLSVSQNI